MNGTDNANQKSETASPESFFCYGFSILRNSSVRDGALYFERMFLTWVLIVFSVSPKFSAISLFDLPSSMRQKTSVSRFVRLTVSLKADKDTKMGVITDVKQALREAYALKISYSARKAQN